jgi:hypothetical protein
MFSESGLEALPQAIGLILNLAMQAERQKYLGLAPYERSSERPDYANGFKDKTIATRVGPVAVAVPQVRSGDFYPSSLEKGIRSERVRMRSETRVRVHDGQVAISSRKTTNKPALRAGMNYLNRSPLPSKPPFFLMETPSKHTLPSKRKKD